MNSEDLTFGIIYHYVSVGLFTTFELNDAYGDLIGNFKTFDQMIEYATKNELNNGRILLVKGEQFAKFKRFSNAKKIMENYREVYVLNYDEHFKK